MSNIYQQGYVGTIGGASGRVDTSVALDGSGTGLRVTSTASSFGDAYLDEPNPAGSVPIAPTTQYTSRIKVHTAQASRTGQLIVDYFDAANAQIGGAAVGADIALTAGVATLVSFTDTSPALATHMRVYLRFKTPTSTQTWLVTEFAVNTGTDSSYPAGGGSLIPTLIALDDDQE